MEIRPCAPADLDDWARLRAALWPDEDADSLRQELDGQLATPTHATINLICRCEEGVAVGFAEAALRHDYVNGCETSPVAFLEGIYVSPGHRMHGVAAALVGRIAAWARDRGCAELASDALLDNVASHGFHTAVGFQETERVVYFRRPL